jgi:hypothetical protein
MRFEEQVMGLCNQALEADDEREVRRVLMELRFVLHQRIETLRDGLAVAYTASTILSKSFGNIIYCPDGEGDGYPRTQEPREKSHKSHHGSDRDSSERNYGRATKRNQRTDVAPLPGKDRARAGQCLASICH